MDIPVYLVAGFLDSGKTNFINGVLEDGFARQDKTLLLRCEEGEEEYNPKALDNVTVVDIEDEAGLTCSRMKELEKKVRPKQVLIEYNGMWQMERLYREVLPANWVLYQIMTFVEAGTSEDYLTGDECPFDLGQPVVDIPDDDFGVWYVDVMDHPDRWAGKEVRMKLLMCHSKKYPGIHCPGRFAMVCCENDIQFLGLVAKGMGLKDYKNRDWVEVSARMAVENHDAYQGKGPVMHVMTIAPCPKPAQDVVTF
ncbi:MAG: hypothetical protein HFF93_04520 [Oscillibacter sp.]|nr:hypothetical protein [Oscillibacter sp.]